ncbi:transglycosylase SLT domain-containing protein [Rhodanobacter denitrificans]|uniref:LysM repeat-containing protein n=1 Tax=Rhodanobacter denitrificans TaxID=666685 RepID=I4WR63_9GAMM|nr:transglycosylase SLT domain-containing protein [Rhodanobacter denitrificans]AGG89365.1 LysM repeat-containing protein [Rhodanobacter denitrificans]EIM01955.1 membrane-bound lytic murein transglycosylase D [Rhodanobacter denitrificans]UJJ60368.1 transglycosylase SLT domain-containing protein [Rhodanobacter denitrificans]UJM88248.1 transglycosylase SLT domain-containing protein [Rhodanobacter denitrificans]UJM88738.1 transglycosylase SLT domain-containing protein [Rhodanobacter denitrificans]
MPGCDADPAVLAWARHYTRHPRQFESQLQAVMPRLVYVQQVADRYDVAGEFVLLPWVESHFQPVPARKRRPAGMWQIMPVTAGAMGLRVDGHYDGRLDVPAAANAVMKLLEQYHEQFHDWRVADYAYNAGEFTIRKMVQAHGMPAAQPAIPQWPVRKVTREHLAKLLGMACVVREPERFNVSLPTLPDEQQLVQTGISHSMPIARAADHAGMSVEALKHLNPAFRNNTIDTSAAPYLILPARHARQFRDALLEQADSSGGDLLAGASRGDTAPSPMPAVSPPRKVHTVRRGDSLWQIARKYSVGVSQLRHWNHLNGHALKPGQTLTVGAPD